jgi:predicted MPP superfamily phosphohydrolase
MPTVLPREYDQGYKEYEGIPVFITSGVGSIGIRMRLFNPPEIVVLTIE